MKRCPKCNLTKEFSEFHKNVSRKTGVGNYCKMCICLNEQHLKAKYQGLYTTWINMKSRCYSKKSTYYKYYGGRGIVVCDKWRYNFKDFYNWAMTHKFKKGLTIDRRDNDGGYNPNNCRFVTSIENSRNRRSTKLTIKKVIEIKKKLKADIIQRKIAAEYFVNPSNISRINTKDAWVDVR